MSNEVYLDVMRQAKAKAVCTGKDQHLFTLEDGGYKIQESGLPWPDDAKSVRLFICVPLTHVKLL